MEASLPMSGVSGGPRHRAGPTLPLSLALLMVALGGLPIVPVSQASLRTETQDPTDGVPELWIDDARIAEGDSGSQVCMFTLHLSAAFAETVSVNVATFDSTAT